MMGRSALEFIFEGYSFDNLFREQNIVDFSREEMPQREIEDVILRNARVKSIRINEKTMAIKKDTIIEASFDYLTEKNGEDIIENVQAVLEHCGFRKLSPRRLMEASLIYAFSLGLTKIQWKKVFEDADKKITKTFHNKQKTYGELKKSVEKMSTYKDGKYITASVTSEIIEPVLKRAIEKKNFKEFYSDETIKNSVVRNYKKTIYYLNKYILDMIEKEIDIFLRYNQTYELEDKQIYERIKKSKKTDSYSNNENSSKDKKSDESKIIDSKDYKNKCIQILGQSIISLKGTDVIKKNWKKPDQLNKEKFYECSISYSGISRALMEYLGYANVAHPLYRALHDMQGAQTMCTSDELDDLSVNNINSTPENCLKYYIWWNKTNNTKGDENEIKEMFYKDKEKAMEESAKAYRARIRFLCESEMGKEYTLPEDITEEFTEDEFKKIVTKWKLHIDNKWFPEEKGRTDDQSTTTRLTKILKDGKPEISRNYLALFGVFTGHSIDYINNCLAKCGFRELSSNNEDFDQMIYDIREEFSKAILGKKSEYNRNQKETTIEEETIDYGVELLRNNFEWVFEPIYKDLIDERMYYYQFSGEPIQFTLYREIEDIVAKYESDIAAMSDNYLESSLYGIVSNHDKSKSKY